MSKLMSLIRRAPKRFSALVLMAAAAVIVPAAVLAWGPDRATFTQDHPASYVTFNSITDNPQVGDERNFVRIKEDGTSTYGDNVTLTPGKVYDVSVYYHNNAAANLNLVANNTTLKMEIPGVVTAGVNAAFTGTISSSNANPTSVWDEAYGKNATSSDIALRYVSNSATFVSNGAINGQKLPDTLFTTGAKLGYNSQDGNLPGCNQYAGFVNFQIRVDQPNFTVQKQVSVDGGKTWAKTATAQPGSTVEYAISYQNTGTNQQDNVSVRDMLPAGVSYVAGTTQIANSTTGGQFKSTVDGITTVGYNAGSYQPKGNVFFKFDAKLPTEDKLQCGANSLVNTARVTTNAGYKEDTATVTVNKDCKPPVVNYTCKALSITQVDNTHFKFSTAYTAENATFKSVTYVVKDSNGKVVDTINATGTTSTYTQSTAGNYTVQATVTFTANGKDVTATSDACKGSFCVKETPKQITVCELSTGKIVTINESDFNTDKYSKNLDDCKNITVCELATKQIVTIRQSEFDANKYSKNLADCKETPPANIQVCDLSTKQIVTIKESDFDSSKYSKDLNDCKETPPATIKVCEISTKQIVTINESDFDTSKYSKDLTVCETTPPELPHTGMTENIVAVVGLGALIASAAYYIASRRALNQ